MLEKGPALRQVLEPMLALQEAVAGTRQMAELVMLVEEAEEAEEVGAESFMEKHRAPDHLVEAEE